jgi:predicted acylesterase/phospholipase RssA
MDVHLVLGGGGVKTLSYAGALTYLEELGYRFSSISAVSAGTFTAALLCAGMPAATLQHKVRELDLKRLAGKRRFPFLPRVIAPLFRPYAAYERPGFGDLFRELMGSDPQFRDLKIPLTTVGIDLRNDRLLVYSVETTPEMSVAEAVNIAVSIPTLYPAYEPPEGGRLIVDAALASNCPVWMATRHDDERPIVALRPAAPSHDSKPRNFVDYVGQAIEAGINTRDDYLIQQISRIREIKIDCGSVRFDQLDISPSERDFLLARGRDAAEDAANRIGMARQVESPVVGTSTVTDAAEAGATLMINEMHRNLNEFTRDRLLISYSHKDQDWCDKFLSHLRPVVQNSEVRLWSDHQIPVGEQWKTEIDESLRSTRVALLLVTGNYLASEFIEKAELPYLLNAAQAGRVKVAWVATGHSMFRETPLGTMQAANDPKKPLESLGKSDQDRVIVDICSKLKTMMESEAR